MADNIIASNRQARFNYNIIESLETGIVLTGTEVKSIRGGNVNFNDSFARADGNEIFLYNLYIAPYEFGNINNPAATRPRKLLLRKVQIRKLMAETTLRHLTMVPLKLYFKHGIVKVDLALAKGKKAYDKRESIKAREVDREIRKRYAK